MKLNTISRYFLAAGLMSCAANAFALEAWSGQAGGNTIEVIFDSKVYSNRWYVNADNCPQGASAENWDNPWSYVRDATKAEIDQYGNPTTCESGSATPVAHDAFSAEKDYAKDDIVAYQDVTYEASRPIPAYSFTPGADNPWKLYTPVPDWRSSQVYNKGDEVKVDGQSYEALYYTVGENPSIAGNQNPTGTNGRPWKPLGPTVEFTQEQFKNAPQINSIAFYEPGKLAVYKGTPYVAQTKVKGVMPYDKNPWAIYTNWTGTKERVGTPKNPWPAHVYAPYVDFSLNSIPDLAKLAKEQNITHFTMAFVVAKSGEQCIPTWGTAYNLQDYSQYSKIKALREAGGDVMVSIGGANNSPLAAACKNVKDLQKLYYDIVDNLNLNVLDFDIEGTWVADQDSIDRRNQAVKEVQAQWKEEGRKVGIWYTLPILPTGLTAEGLYVLENARHVGVELAGINVMTMDYGNAVCQSDGTEGQNIHGKCATSAIDNMFTQLKKIWPEKSDKEINAMMGTTPMIGYNDVQGEVFYLSDAKLVMDDAKKRNLGMIGAWSMTRDQPGVAKQVSPEHSGMTAQQAPMYAYSQVFAPFTHDNSADEASTDLAGDVKAVYIDVFDGQQRINVNFDTSKLSGSNSYSVDVDGKYAFSTSGNSVYYSYRSNYGTQSTVRTGGMSYMLAPGKVITVKRTNPNPEILAQLTVTRDMQEGNNPVKDAGEVKSLTVKKINGVPNVVVDFDAKALGLKAANGSAWVVKVMGDAKNGNYIFSCDNGNCYYSSVKTAGDITTVTSGERDISEGETIVVERVTPNPATVAKLVVTKDMLK